jgi:two-component system, OmpR family, phosphate regulon sensor histidine kinase PhoR
MTRFKLVPNTIFIFIFSLVALVTSFVLYIYWYIEISSGLDEVIQKFHIDPQQVAESQTALVIIVLTLLVSLIVTGLSMSFVYTQKMQQLYRLQNNFINNFTHELKTPVTSMQLYLETFLKHDLDKETQEKYLNYMLCDVHRLSDNISNILDLGRIESQNFKDEFVEQDIIAFITDFYQQNAHLFRGLEINIEPVTEQRVAISEPLFEMLLINLATNALKYNKSEQPRLTVRVSKVNKRNAQLSFIDNGIGIDHSQRKKIFKKFYQVGRSQIRSAQGSGLGLYLVKNIAKAHHGEIKIKVNKKEKGTEFILQLPFYTKQPMAKSARKMMGLK